MAFDAGAIIAHLDIELAEADRKLRDFEHRADRAARDRHMRIDATFDDASIGKARHIFAQLDNQLSRDAAQRLRSSPQGSVLGALNALFSPHQISGSTTAQQAVSQGFLGQVAKQSARSLPGGSTTSTQTIKENVDEQVKRSFLGGLLGGGLKGIFSGGGGGGATGVKGGSGFLGGLLGGIGPNILGLSTRGSGIIAGGALGLGALPALLGPAAALGVGALGIGAGAGILKSALSSNNITQYVQQYQAAQNALQAATTPQQRKQAQIAMATATQGARQIAGPAGFAAFNALNSIQNNWQNFTAGFLPTAAKILNTVSSLFSRLLPVLQTFFGSAVKLLSPFIAALGDIATQLLPLLAKAFQMVAPFIRPLIDGLGGLVINIVKGFLPALKAVGPIIGPFARILANLGKDIGALFADVAPAFQASAVILKALLGLIGGLLPVVAKLADIFAKALAPVIMAFAKVIESLEPTLLLIGKVLASLAGAILKDLVSAFMALANLIKDIGPALNIFAKALESAFTILENSGVFATLGNVLEQIVPVLANLINLIAKQLGPVLPQLITAFAKFVTILTVLAAAGLTTIIQAVTWLLQKFPVLVPILAAVAAGWWAVNVALSANPIGLIIIVITALIGAITLLVTHWKRVWGDIKHWAEDAWNFLTTGWFSKLFPAFALIRAEISFVAKHWRGAWNDIKNVAETFWRYLSVDFAGKIGNFFTSTLPGWFRSAVAIVGRVWTGIQAAVSAPINWIITHPIDGLIHAFDWISSKVGGPNIPALAPIQLSHGGRIGGFGGGDVVPALLEPGETVVDKQRSQAYSGLFAMMGVPGHKRGGIIGDIGSFFGDLFHGGGLLAALATGNLAAATSDFFKLLGGTGVGGAVGDLAGLLTAIPRYLIGRAVHELIGLFSSSGGGAGGGVPGNVGSYKGVILRVLAMLGQPLSDLGVVDRQMATESGGQPGVVNKWDSNWKAGHPSVGLMQVIQGTFDQFAGPFRNVGPFLYGVSTNPLANIFAGLNYAIHTYGPGWTSVLGQGHGYDNGGWLKPGWALNMTKGREAVLTPEQSSAFMAVAEYARQSSKGSGHGVMRDVYLTLPEGATVARALSELTFKLNTMTQEAGVMTP